MASGYRQEFFDRDYSLKEVYSRLWGYARRYRARLIVGVVCGILTAGTLVPMFGMIQPALARIETLQVQPASKSVPAAAESPKPDEAKSAAATSKNDVDREARKLTREFDKARSFLSKIGVDMQDDEDSLGLPLLFCVIVVLPVIALVRLGLSFLNHYCLAWAGMKTVRDVRVDLLEHILEQSMQFHGRIDVGQLMSRSTGDPAQIQMIMQGVLQELAQAPFEIAVSLGFIIWTAQSNGMLSTLGLLAIGFPMFMVPVIFLSKRIRKWSRKALERFSFVGSRIHEILTCIRAVKAYDTEKYEGLRYREANDSTLKATLRALRWGLLVGPAVETVGIVLLCAFLVWCFVLEVKLSAIVPMLAPLLIAYKPIKQLSKLQIQLEQGRVALARLWSLMDVRLELPEKAEPVTKKSFDGSIAFENVFFRYETADRDAVSGASFEIPRGKMVAVVGGTGSGKTTMSGLLSRFFDPREGRVTMDGVDLRDLCISDLRKLVGAVQQETLLFNDTIEENIKYGTPNATHEEVVAAAKMANAHDFIMSQPGGYARMCGEKGFALSGGERQRIAIARAILRNPPILILDEATSALDTVTERLVQDALTKLMQNRTVFAIAHRLSTIRNADLILVMDHGAIVERGTHDELYAKDGVYRKLCDMQTTT